MSTTFILIFVIVVVTTIFHVSQREQNPQFTEEAIEVETEGYFTERVSNILFVCGIVIFGIGGILISLGIIDL